MPEESASERTEESTQRKRTQARERGQIPRSRDFSAAVVVFSIVVFLRFGGGWMAQEMINVAGSMLERIATTPIPVQTTLVARVTDWLLLFAHVIFPVFLVGFTVAIAVGLAQAGFVFSAEAISLKFEKLNPVSGLKRMFNLRAFMTLAMNLCKVALVLAVAYGFFSTRLFASRAAVEIEAPQMVLNIVTAVLDLMLRLSAIMLLLAMFDLWYQRYQWYQDLKMTKQEMKEEMRDTDGDPQIRNRRRQIQRQLAMQRMMAEVPKADVVVKNPTHYAVALRYDPEQDTQPVIVAKGMNKMALRIIKVAIDNNVPVKYQPDLARKLHRLELGDVVPEDLYQAVAEVLAWVVKMGRGRRMESRLAS